MKRQPSDLDEPAGPVNRLDLPKYYGRFDGSRNFKDRVFGGGQTVTTGNPNLNSKRYTTTRHVGQTQPSLDVGAAMDCSAAPAAYDNDCAALPSIVTNSPSPPSDAGGYRFTLDPDGDGVDRLFRLTDVGNAIGIADLKGNGRESLLQPHLDWLNLRRQSRRQLISPQDWVEMVANNSCA